MAKKSKSKNKNRVKKKALRAMKKVKKDGPAAGAWAALGGFVSAILSSDELKDGARALIGAGVARMRDALQASTRKLEQRTDDDDDSSDRRSPQFDASHEAHA